MKMRVAVFFGSKACEHEISCISANQVLHALDQDKYEVIPVYIAKNKDFYTGEALFDLSNYYDLDALCAKLTKVSLCKDGHKTYLRPIKEGLFKSEHTDIDVAFLVNHGTNGEDGTLQGMMEMMDIPYTSSGVLGAAIGQDKVIMKEVLNHEGLPLVPWTYFRALDLKEDKDGLISKLKDFGLPLILKPANLGSSIGIEVVHEEAELEAKIKEVLKYDDKILVEKYMSDFKEVNCAIIGDGESFRTSVLEEVLKDDEILSFDGKYVGNAKGAKSKLPTKGAKGGMANTSRLVPAPLSDEMTEEIKALALKAYRALDAFGCARIDFMVIEDEIYLTELNTIPGSLAFYLWKEVDIDFTKECDILIENAIKRYRHKEKMSFSFNTNILSTFKGGRS